MPKIAIVTDSTALFTREEKSQFQIETVPLNIMFEGKVYRDGVDLTTKQAYQFLEKNPEDWATSAPAVGEFLAVFKKHALQGTKEIICLTLTKSVSATWNNARMAKEIAKKELPEVKIEVIDSNTGLAGETLIILRIARAVKEGKKFQEIIDLTEKLKSKIRVYLLLETIRYVYRSGRIPEVASKVGALLPLKPILSFFGGRVHFAGATTSMEKSKEKIIKNLEENWDPSFPEISLMYIDNLKEIEEVKKEISFLLPSARISISEFSSIIGYATGRGTFGIGFFAK